MWREVWDWSGERSEVVDLQRGPERPGGSLGPSGATPPHTHLGDISVELLDHSHQCGLLLSQLLLPDESA